MGNGRQGALNWDPEHEHEHESGGFDADADTEQCDRPRELPDRSPKLGGRDQREGQDSLQAEANLERGTKRTAVSVW